MNVRPISIISSVYSGNLTKTNNRKTRFDNQKSDSFSFTGYNSIVKSFVESDTKRESGVAKFFKEIMTSIISDKSIAKSPEFETINAIYKKKGMYNLLRELGLPRPSIETAAIARKLEDGRLILASKGDEAIMELTGIGRQGFWNSVFDVQTAPRDVRIGFNSGKNSIELYLDKKSDVFIDKSSGEYETVTGFHSVTGNRKVSINYYGGKPDVVYYNQDGSENFWKNFFYGGTPTEAIY